jgi:hypothetical protein
MSVFPFERGRGISIFTQLRVVLPGKKHLHLRGFASKGPNRDISFTPGFSPVSNA